MCYNTYKDGVCMPKPLSIDEVKKRIFDKHNGKIELVGNYVKVKSKATMKCNVCGLLWESVPYDIYSGHGCPVCGGNKKLDNQTFKNQVLKLVGEEYSVLGEYISTHIKIKMKHNRCGNVFFMEPNAFKSQGQRCPECMRKQIPISNRIPLEIAQKRLREERQNEFEIVSGYIGTRSKANVKHEKCGKTFECYPTQLIHHKTGCPYCYSSNGEDIVREVLRENGYYFKEQFRIAECKDKRSLPFDFCVNDKNGDVLCLIEYQGIQHFKPKFGYANFEKTQFHDKLKKDFCEANAIPLIVIKYKRTTNYQILKQYIEDIISTTIPSQA